MRGLSLAVRSRGYFLVAVHGFSCCGAQALVTWAQRLRCAGSVVAAPGLYNTGSIGVAHGLSGFAVCIREQTHFSCTGRRILYHRSIREAPKSLFLSDERAPQRLWGTILDQYPFQQILFSWLHWVLVSACRIEFPD